MLVDLEEEELVEIGVCDLLHRLDVVARDELVVGVKELDTGFFESTLRKEEMLDTGQTLVRVVVCLHDEGELLTLRLVQAALNGVGILQLLQREN